MAQLSKISCSFTSCPPSSQLARDYCDWEDRRNDFLSVSCIQQANRQEYKETNHSVKNVALHFCLVYVLLTKHTPPHEVRPLSSQLGVCICIL